MEAFKVFATLSLVDLMSNPLARIRAGMNDVDRGAASLSSRFANLAASMAPLAVAGGAVLGAFGKCVATAAGFEDQMAKVGAISRASASDLQALEAKARELGATTQFTASQVGEAEQYLAMAGFSVKDNIAALPGVLNLAAATATDLGRAADISSDILGAFGMKANEMGRVADVLAMTCSTANTNMELLGETMKYVAPVARTAGLSIEETAAMAGLLGNVGIKGSQAGTTLKAMLNKMAAPTSEAKKQLDALGVATRDAAGNLRSPIQVLGEMAGKLKTMGTAEQMAAMKAVVGEEAVAGFAELIQKGGVGAIEEYITKLRQADGACDEMAKTMSNTLAGDMRGLGSAFESVQITIGKIFIPILRKGAQGVTQFLRWIDKLAQSPIGKFFLQLAAGISAAILGIAAFAGVMWGLTSLGGLISRTLLPLKAAIMGVSAPMLALIGVAALLYAAFRTNFGGMADFVTQFWNRAAIAVKGVLAVFQNLKNGNAELKGELAAQIKANGLTGFVQTVSRAIARVLDVFAGFKKGLAGAFDGISDALFPARLAIAEIMHSLANLFGIFKGDEVSGSRASWQAFGETLGEMAGGVLTGLARGFSALVTAIGWLGKGLGFVIDYASALCGWLLRLTGAGQSASDAANPTSWTNLGKALGALLATIAGVKAATLAWKGVMLVVTGVTRAWAVAQGILNAAMRANPLGIVISLCMALAAAAGWIISNWETVKGWWHAFWGGLGEKCQAAWDYVKQACADAWNNMLSAIGGVGENILATLASVWAGITESASGAWTSLTGGAANAWTAIVDSLANFGSNLLAAIQGAWDQVMAFFDGLNLFESGAKLIGTFIDGIKSMIGSLVDSVSGALAKVRNFLPFSDAHEGPLSTLTLSGSRMMTTLAEGVAQGKATLAASVSGALGEAGKEIDGFKDSMALPAIETAASNLPDLSLAAPPIPDLKLAELPDLALGAPNISELALPEIPQLEPPAITIPEAPAVAPEDTVNDRGHREGETKNGNQTVTINISAINMPDVTDGPGFLKSLQGVLQSEIGALEGMA